VLENTSSKTIRKELDIIDLWYSTWGGFWKSIYSSLYCILEALSTTHTILLYVFHICSTLYEVSYISK